MTSMDKMQEALNARLSQAPSLSKVKALAKQSADGHLTSFTGLFGAKDLSPNEQAELHEILRSYQPNKDHDVRKDLAILVAVTSEVRAITNQAALLHGERIKRVQNLLKKYREGAFSAWLVATYGNRQTPYNFLLYYEFYEALPKELKTKIEEMPRQAIYALASRQIPIEKKQEVVTCYKGQTKREMLEMIRSLFPLAKNDGRKNDPVSTLLLAIEKQLATFQRTSDELSSDELQEIAACLRKFLFFVEMKK